MAAGDADAGSSANFASHSFLQLLGYGAVLTEVLLSGFASIYFERVVKSTTEVVTIWERNFQLAVYSMAVYVVCILYDLHTGARTEVGSGWTYITFGVSFLGALGGLLVAATLKYADSILKTLASAGAIVLSTVLGHLWMDGPFGLIVCIGAMTTILSIMNYSWDSTIGNGSSSGASALTSSSPAVATQKV
jgi:UDP-sugar transporter A1/2/3